MRLHAGMLAPLVLIACQPDTAASSGQDARAGQANPAPTLEELGQDDPSIPFVPAPVGPARSYEAASKTAMSFTPGILTVTPTPQVGPNAAPGAVFSFQNGYTLETTMEPGGAMMGQQPFDFSKFIVGPGGGPIDPQKVVMYSVDKETLPSGSVNGGFCEKTSFLATYARPNGDADDLTILAFTGESWPPGNPEALCGSFMYAGLPH